MLLKLTSDQFACRPSPFPSVQNWFLLPSQKYFFSPDVPAPLSPGPVPYPTLYSGQGKDQQAPPQGAIQILLYNMSSMLASVAAGYDVRLSNVSPIHPKLNPNK